MAEEVPAKKAEAAKEKVDHAKEKAHEQVQAAKEKAVEQVKAAKEKASDKVEAAKEKAQEKVEAAKEKAEEKVEAAKEKAEEDASPSSPTPKKSGGRRRATTPAADATAAAQKGRAKEKAPKAPRRPTLDAETRRLLGQRDAQDDRRPKFTRQASYRYWRIGRWENWRTPRGVQSKQRRHYKYRSTVVSIGFGTPRRVRGLTPTGFRPIIIRTTDDLARLDVQKDAAIIARTVGTRRRLALEESARKRGVHLLNPLVKERGEE